MDDNQRPTESGSGTPTPEEMAEIQRRMRERRSERVQELGATKASPTSNTSSTSVTTTGTEQPRTIDGKKAAIFGGAGVATVALVAGLFIMNPFAGDKKEEAKPGAVATQEAPEPTALVTTEETPYWLNGSTVRYPIQVGNWQRSPWSSGQFNLSQELKKEWANTTLSQQASQLPIAAAGFTSDPAKKTLGGVPNPQYVPVTDEDYLLTVGNYVERLVNPVYGDWKSLQYGINKPAQNFKIKNFEDMLTKDFIQRNQGKNPKEFMPLYADWDANDYGMGNVLLKEGPRWLGQATKVESNITWDEKSNSRKYQVRAQVIYKAWTQVEEEITSKPAELVLDLVDNPDPQAKSMNKLLVDKASLTFK